MSKSNKKSSSQQGKKNKTGKKKPGRGALSGSLQIPGLLSAGFDWKSSRAPASEGNTVRMFPQSVTSIRGGNRVTGSCVLVTITPETQMWSTAINAGLSELFPALAAEASRFSQYEFQKLDITYVNAVGTDVVGTIVLSSQPNVTAPPPTSYTQASSFGGAMSTPVWKSGTYQCPKSKRLYLRSGLVPDGQDPKTYDNCQITFLLENYADGASPGYLLASYVCDLTDQVLNPPQGCEKIGQFDMLSGNTSFDLYEGILSAPVLHPIAQWEYDADAGGLFLGIPAGYWELTGTLSLAGVTGTPPANVNRPFLLLTNPDSGLCEAGTVLNPWNGTTTWEVNTPPYEENLYTTTLAWGIYQGTTSSGIPSATTWINVGFDDYGYDYSHSRITLMLCQLPPNQQVYPSFPMADQVQQVLVRKRNQALHLKRKPMTRDHDLECCLNRLLMPGQARAMRNWLIQTDPEVYGKVFRVGVGSEVDGYNTLVECIKLVGIRRHKPNLRPSKSDVKTEFAAIQQFLIRSCFGLAESSSPHPIDIIRDWPLDRALLHSVYPAASYLERR